MEIDTLSIRPKEDLGIFFYITINILNEFELSKAILSTNILIEIYLYLLISCPDTSPLISTKKDSFTIFLPTRGHHAIYKSNTITKITELIEHFNTPVIFNPCVHFSHLSQRSVIPGIYYDLISSED